MSAPGDKRRAAFFGSGWPATLAKLAVSTTLVVLLLRRISWATLRGELAQTHVVWLVVPLAIILASNVLGAAQWHWILRSSGIGLGFWRTLRAYYGGLFLNNFMLGSVGGDVYKIYSVGRGVGEVGRVAGATIVDRMVGLSALCALAVVASLAELPHQHVPLQQTLLVLGFSVGIMGVASLLLHPRYGEALARRVEALPLGRWSPRLRRVLDHLRDYRARTRLLNGAFALSLLIQGSRVVAHFCVGHALGWSLHAVDLGKFFLVIPILGLIISLPISFGGWGVREWAGMALFAPLGHGGEEAVTLLALTATLTFVASLIGALALLGGTWPATPAGGREANGGPGWRTA